MILSLVDKKNVHFQQMIKLINPQKLKVLRRKKYLLSKLAKKNQKYLFLFLALLANLL